ncbi:putative bifunctional diguanylate cyclase/phosphodiesterase [Aureimonas leprariae]|nr:GGDEF domain-containing phosphodiesterase [Aureimonas leprariae]
MRQLLERYWATVAGFSVIAGCVVLGVGYIGNTTVHDILATSMEKRGQRFADVLSDLPRAADALLTGLSRDPDQETDIRRAASLAGIDSFAVFAADGRETFRSRSDQYEWLLRDRPGGVTSGSRLAASVVGREGDFRIVGSDRNGKSSVLVTLDRAGKRIGFVSIWADPAFERRGFAVTLAAASLKVLGLLLTAAGVPLLVYVRRKNKIAEAAERIDFLANRDPLTRLLNRRRMQEEVDRAVTTARATRAEFLYCCIDIDGLSEINDTLGQAHGDELLKVVANRLASAIDSNDLLARIAADDFALLVRRAGKPEDLAALAQKLRASVAEPIELKGKTVRPQISIGVSRMPRDGRTQNDLVKHAQLALSHHKASRMGDFVEFESSMDAESDRRRLIETLVRNAVENDGFELAYQPLVSGDGNALIGFEALLRLRDEEHRYVSPSVFVPVAEARGYIKDIGTWVIREAARQVAQWPEHVTVSVNLSAVQFRDGDLVDIVADALASAGIAGHRLEVEVVESLILERTDSVLSQLRELKALGVSIAMDDFGTGYSSLGYLWKFPFDKLKIDRSFMVALDEGEANVPEILGTIISMAHLMRMRVTTEGVETEAQAELLQALGCDILQGYRFGKPMRPTEVAADVLTRFADRRVRPLPEPEPVAREDEASVA